MPPLSKPNPSYWTSMSVIRNLILLGSKSDNEVAEVCEAAGIDLDHLNHLEIKVPLQVKILVIKKLLSLSQDTNLGLHVGEKASPPMLGSVGHLQESSKDVLSAFKKTFPFSRTFTTVYDRRIEEANGEAWLYYEPVKAWVDASPETAIHGVSIPFSGTMNFIRLLSGKRVIPIRVMYRGEQIHDMSEHERIFGCTPSFNQQANAIVFNTSDLEIPIFGYNPQLNVMLEKLLRDRLKELEEGVHFSTKVREAISLNYQFDFPHLENIALALNITPRTLQRKLQDENTTYRELSDTIRYELASTLLKYKELTISEIAYKLGYSELNSFRKAFKQWSGVTPIHYRSTIASQSPGV
ncbi:MAG: AraC family transcriptional regulator [Bacteroidota bacterium]